MIRHRSTALAGLGAALLSNYWVLEWWLADRTDTPSSWISDIATRTEASGWRFQLLAILSGLAIAALALLLRRVRGRMLSRGVGALLGAGIFVAIAGAAPLSCPEGIEPGCPLAEDPLDAVHALATGGEILATALAFLLIGLGLLPAASRAGRATLALGAVWLLLTAATGLAYVSGDIEAVKGILQRSAQVLFGVWLALLGIWFSGERG